MIWERFKNRGFPQEAKGLETSYSIRMYTVKKAYIFLEFSQM
jgi:hypothetical protein